MSLKNLILFLTLWLLSNTAWNADLGTEQRLQAQLRESVRMGEAVALSDGEREFLGIHLRSTAAKPLGAVILLHDMNMNADASEVIQPLRVGLAEHAWDTLSIQLPLAYPGATQAQRRQLILQTAPRISAATDYLKQRDRSNIVLVGHGWGANAAIEFLAADATPELIRAVVAIGLSGAAIDTQLDTLDAIRKLRLPIYDLYGERDSDSVLRSARERKLAAIDAGNTLYRQTQWANADHGFSSQSQQLLGLVRSWLKRYASGD